MASLFADDCTRNTALPVGGFRGDEDICDGDFGFLMKYQTALF